MSKSKKKGQITMKKTWHSLKNRVTAMLLALICVLGLLPTAALAAGADTIKLERFGMSGVSYQSASLGRCTMHQMYYGVAGKTSVGFCGTKGGGMGTSLIGQTWGAVSYTHLDVYKRQHQFCNKILGKTKDFVLFLNFSKPGGGHYFTHLKGVCFIRRFLLIAVTVQREPNYIPPPHQNLANQLARFFDFQPKKGAIC